MIKPIVARASLGLICTATKSRFVQLSHERSEGNDRIRNERLARLFLHASRVPFYADKIQPEQVNEVNAERLLQTLPVTTKEAVESQFPDGITDGSDPADWRMMSTRGTAKRLITIQGFEKRDAVRAASLRMLRESGGYRVGLPTVEIPPEVCENVCGELGEEDSGVLAHLWGMVSQKTLRDPKSIRDLRGLIERNWIYNRRTYSGFGIHGSHPPDEVLCQYVDGLRRDRPFLLKALSTYLTTIARFIKRKSLAPLSIPVIKTMGSRVTPCQRGLIESAFGGVFWDDYGSAEFGSIACECDEHNGMHVFDDFFVVEVVDDNGVSVPDGTAGHILVTDLMNLTMPLIRYRIGDVGIVQRSPCRCGRQSPRITVQGRSQDVLMTHDNRMLTQDSVVDFLEALPGVDTAQVIEESTDHYRISIVASDQSMDAERVSAEFAGLVGGSPKVDLNVVTTLRPEAGGKFRYVKGLPRAYAKA